MNLKLKKGNEKLFYYWEISFAEVEVIKCLYEKRVFIHYYPRCITLAFAKRLRESQLWSACNIYVENTLHLTVY